MAKILNNKLPMHNNKSSVIKVSSDTTRKIKTLQEKSGGCYTLDPNYGIPIKGYLKTVWKMKTVPLGRGSNDIEPDFVPRKIIHDIDRLIHYVVGPTNIEQIGGDIYKKKYQKYKLKYLKLIEDNV